MLNEDWVRLGKWLDTLKTDTMWSLPQLVEEFERTHPKITWANDERQV
jgi:hypothetical protein